MKVMHTVELPDGTVNFQGTLEGPELAIVIEAGLNLLLGEGAIPFVSKEFSDESGFVMQPPEMDQ